MDIDIKALRILRQVIKDKSFSAAARSLKLTQPTISQQIAKLESEMGLRLFERVGHDIIPTDAAKNLFTFAEKILDQYQDFVDSFKSDRSQIRGLVKYAMPETCQWTPHFKKIMKQLSEFPEIQFEIDILPNDEIVKGLLEGRYDFAFVTGEKLAPELRFEKFSDEKYSAVGVNKGMLSELTKEDSEKLRLISYPGWELFFTTWAKSYGLWEKLKETLKKPTVYIGNLSGAIHAVKEGAGISVIPSHCLAGELESGELVEILPKKSVTAACPIYLTRKVGSRPSQRVEHVLNLLRTAKKDLG